jgi:putative aminopeptidase FrvX
MMNYKYNDINLLEQLCRIQAPSGSESAMTQFLLRYIKEKSGSWKVPPEVLHGHKYQDCIMLKFGKPRTAIFAHMDSIGFTVRYEDQLVAIGGPAVSDGQVLVGRDHLGQVECTIKTNDEGQVRYHFGRNITPGTTLTYKCEFDVSDSYITSCYLDNRLGIFNALKVAEDLEDGLIIFTCYEEHGGGSVPFLAKYMVEDHQVFQALVSDITWVTDGVKPGEGPAISLRDRNIPRKLFLDKILKHAAYSGIPYQIEVEGMGSSDGRELQHSPYPIDWCFIGAAEQHVHSPEEKVHRLDIDSMIDMYKYLMKRL